MKNKQNFGSRIRKNRRGLSKLKEGKNLKRDDSAYPLKSGGIYRMPLKRNCGGAALQ